MELKNIYPQYISAKKQDRRQDQLSYTGVEKRSGQDRRNPFRLDNKLWKDFTQSKTNTRDVWSAFIKLDTKIQQNSNPVQVVSSYKQAGFDNNKVKFEKAVEEGLLSSIPYARRYYGARDAFNKYDDTKGWGKLAILAINIPEDARDTWSATKQILHIPEKEGIVRVPNTHQVRFSFFRGTLLEPLLKIPYIGRKLYNIDKSLDTTAFGSKIIELLGSPNISSMKTSRPDKIKGGFVRAYMVEGKALSEILVRAMMRIPVLSIVAFSALEIPALYRAFTSSKNIEEKTKNTSKQMLKSVINVGSFMTLSSILGAFLASKKGATGSLIGLGLGSYFGSKLGNCLNAQIDRN